MENPLESGKKCLCLRRWDSRRPFYRSANKTHGN